MGLYTVRETREIIRTALVDADNANDANMLFQNKFINHSGKVDIHSTTDERHIVVKEYEEGDK